jgi:agmatine deiminase
MSEGQTESEDEDEHEPGPEPTSPAALGYRMPAEWEPHEATWIAWPHNREDWPGKFAPIPWVYTEIVRLLSKVEPVNILVKGRKMKRDAADRLDAAGVDLSCVTFVKAPTDRAWTRDSGPTFVVSDRADDPADRLGLIDWRFNGWAKYDNHKNDNRVPTRIARKLGVRAWVPHLEVGDGSRRVVMEGGAIDVNGRGALLTTEECLLSDIQARNPGLDRLGVEKVFAECLAAVHVVWLGQGIVGDDTHGHVDDVARFIDPRTVVAAVETRESDPNYERLQDNWRRLREARDQDGHPLRVVDLPMPVPVVFQGQRLPASYANFYIANGLVLVPTFNDPNDRKALNVLASVFPDRDVVGVHCVDLVLGLGTLHCLTQQQPASPGRPALSAWTTAAPGG